ncbi:MAG TPA: YkgJ family cysteine cluster protein [Bryobacteraceae bacterium]|nr:YkgJ family cysteine cluster protein [Bryobacteraceae bacterium]
MLTDLVQIRRLGEQKRAENFRFRSYLKRHDYSDRRLRRLGEQTEAGIDCTQCANCCRVAEAGVTERDIKKLARFLGVTGEEFRRDFTQRGEFKELILKRSEAGCVFLKSNLCSVYEARPRSCANFPNLVRGQGSIASRMWQFVDRACYCPIVYNWMEAVKKEMGFR